MDDNSIMTYGKKYKGEKLANVPAEYLLYIYNHQYKWLPRGLAQYIIENMDVLKSQAKQK